MVTRRQFLAQSAGLLAAPSMGVGATREVVDVLGNVVRLNAVPRRIVLLDATDFYFMAALLPDPAERIVGWASAARLDLGAQSWLLGDGFPEVGKISPGSVSVEAILSLNPDLVVASAYMMPEGAVLKRHLDSIGIPVAWTSDYEHDFGPAEKFHRAVSFWGAVLDQGDARVAELTALGMSQFEALKARPATGDLPRVYMEIMTTYDSCCWAAGRSFWGDLFALAGGDLIAESDGWGAQLSTEGLMARNPEVYIATGGNFALGLQPGIAPGLDPDEGRAGLRQAAQRPALRDTDAVRNGRVHGIWSGLISSPLFLPVLAERLAKWLHPAHFADLDPTATLAALNACFPKPLPDPMWLSIGDE